MGEHDEMVVIVVGMPCVACRQPILTQDDKPVLFKCEGCGGEHVWHEKCLPPELAEQLMHRRTAPMN